MPEVRLSGRATKDLDALSDRTAAQVLEALERLGGDPQGSALDVKTLSGRKPWRRLRVGKHRVLFRSALKGELLLIARVIDRKELERAIRTVPG